LLISPGGVAPTRIVDVSASCYPPLHHKVQKKLSSGTGSPGWSRKKSRKTVVCIGLKAANGVDFADITFISVKFSWGSEA